MKKLAIVAAAVALGLVIVAGILWGPRLYSRLFSPMTPAGRVERVEKVASFMPSGAGTMTLIRGVSAQFIDGGSAQFQPDAGYQLWVVRFIPSGDRPAELPGRPFVIDETGEKHMAVWNQLEEADPMLVFCLPESKTPQKIQFGDSAAVQLPR